MKKTIIAALVAASFSANAHLPHFPAIPYDGPYEQPGWVNEFAEEPWKTVQGGGGVYMYGWRTGMSRDYRLFPLAVHAAIVRRDTVMPTQIGLPLAFNGNVDDPWNYGHCDPKDLYCVVHSQSAYNPEWWTHIGSIKAYHFLDENWDCTPVYGENPDLPIYVEWQSTFDDPLLESGVFIDSATFLDTSDENGDSWDRWTNEPDGVSDFVGNMVCVFDPINQTKNCGVTLTPESVQPGSHVFEGYEGRRLGFKVTNFQGDIGAMGCFYWPITI